MTRSWLFFHVAILFIVMVFCMKGGLFQLLLIGDVFCRAEEKDKQKTKELDLTNYYTAAHSVKEEIREQPSCLIGGKLKGYQVSLYVIIRSNLSIYFNVDNSCLLSAWGYPMRKEM